ncbi:hypothetical protein [Burkholderia gladioli]|uniref:hypothetical protein n=2 Tax=Burkholderiaceae TaxID=119060 RepID=UPI000F52B129|nr:hypothetical protein [Burkholderia gladioli]MBJ9664940.1 hypothetical protein [Burkholderia gladioli]MBJ9715062.1 hypothetical protein [Burkholderia gladioli]MBU9156903.1 hypothetical protein [Burkholderia gladioli]MBU9379963.1 hypothetical protein [Burkholderia gladioli]MCH7274553.1 hypothetical protein [Burkholderia gladioli]
MMGVYKQPLTVGGDAPRFAAPHPRTLPQKLTDGKTCDTGARFVVAGDTAAHDSRTDIEASRALPYHLTLKIFPWTRAAKSAQTITGFTA